MDDLIAEMDKAILCLRFEVPVEVWEDVDKRWQRVKQAALSAYERGRASCNYGYPRDVLDMD